MINIVPKQTEQDQHRVQFRLDLEGEMANRFNRVKARYGLRSNAEVVRVMITDTSNNLMEALAQ